MDESHQQLSESVRNFWDRYIQVLDNCGINVKFRRWYVKRVEEYIQYFPDERLRTHTPQHVVRFFTEVGLQTGLSDWQFRQVVDAIRKLFCNLLALEWCDEVDWHYWLECSERLSPQHATLAREPVDVPETSTIAGMPHKEVRERFGDAITRLVKEIRIRGYSIRTEQSYERWVIKFLSHQAPDDLESISGSHVKRFLEHLVIKDNVSASTQNQALNALVFFSLIP